MKSNQSGFTVVGAVIIIVACLIIGAVKHETDAARQERLTQCLQTEQAPK